MKKVVLVTGTTSSLGKEVAEYLADKGYTVYGGARGSQKSRKFSVLKLDITKNKDCRQAIKKIVNKEGRLDVLVNNAGYTIIGPFEKFTDKEYLNLLDTNTVGAFRLIKEALPVMRRQKGGRIINISSLSGLVSFPNFSLYSASKHALEALGTALRYELMKDNIFVTNLEPGAVRREFEGKKVKLPHKPAREKFMLFKFILPLVLPPEISASVERLIEDSRPPANLPVGRDALLVSLLKRLMPGLLWDRLMFYVWRR